MDGHVVLDNSRSSGRALLCPTLLQDHGGDTELGDGGFTKWTQTLLGDTKERLLISGIGTERAVTSTPAS